MKACGVFRDQGRPGMGVCQAVRNGYPLREIRNEDWRYVTLLHGWLFTQFLGFFRNNFIYNLIFSSYPFVTHRNIMPITDETY